MTTTKKDSIDFEKQIEKLKTSDVPSFDAGPFAHDLKHHDDRGELDLTKVIDKYKKDNIDLKSQLVEKDSLLKGTRSLVQDYLKAGYKYAARVKELEKISKAHQAQVGEQMVELKFQTTKANTLEKQVSELKKDNKKLAQHIDDLTNVKNKGEFGK
jgi:vacuolar-type H+-ATPase subunit I/STV1|tara:strand:- start:253 stop:720 length:468 start_codon:yes stop_codon:yes gene_type:complete